MRFPNGYGSIYKLSGKRRRPFIVRKTVGWEIIDGKLKQQFQTIGYYESRPKAIEALAEFNKNPYTVEASTVTFAEVYKRWSERRFKKLSDSNVRSYKMAYNLSEALYDLRFMDLRTEHLQDVIDNCGKGYDTVRKIRVLYNQLFDYAMEHNVVAKNYTEYIEMPEKEDTGNRIPFTEKEIKILWENVGRMDFIDTILMMIYTGFRISELLLINNADINLEERHMKGGIKTAAGKNRLVPINKKILSLIKSRFEQGYEFMIVNAKHQQMKYDNYYKERWMPIMEQLGMNHKPHDCRHTCATLLDNTEANKLSIKKILGHASQDITDKIYTHKDIEELKKAIDLI